MGISNEPDERLHWLKPLTILYEKRHLLRSSHRIYIKQSEPNKILQKIFQRKSFKMIEFDPWDAREQMPV
jgi:hypothetical protein